MKKGKDNRQENRLRISSAIADMIMNDEPFSKSGKEVDKK
jgi:hypothetical protein